MNENVGLRFLDFDDDPEGAIKAMESYALMEDGYEFADKVRELINQEVDRDPKGDARAFLVGLTVSISHLLNSLEIPKTRKKKMLSGVKKQLTSDLAV